MRRWPSISLSVYLLDVVCLVLIALLVSRTSVSSRQIIRVLILSIFILLGATATVMYLSKMQIVFRSAMAIHFVALQIVLIVSSLESTTVFAIVGPFVLFICVSEEYPANIVMSVSAVVISYLTISLNELILTGASVPGAALENLLANADIALYGILIALCGSFLLKYRENLIRGAGEIARLMNANTQLTEANLNYQSYALSAERQAMSEERKRITRDIHDVVNHALTSNLMIMEAIADMVEHDPGSIPKFVDLARENTKEALGEIRHALHLLRAQEGIHPETGLRTIARMVHIFEIATGGSVRLEFGNVPDDMTGELLDVLIHVVREGLTNAMKHGQAKRMDVLFWTQEGSIDVTIRDNGVGTDSFTEGIGLSGMRERVERIGGTMEVRARFGEFTIAVILPYEGAA